MVRSFHRALLLVVAGVLLSLLSACHFTSGDGADGGVTTPGSGAILSSTPQSEAFGTVNVGAQSASATLTIANGGGGASGALAVTILGGTGAFGADADGCTGTSLAPGTTCTVRVHFAPKSAGAQSGTLTVSAAGTLPVTVALSGTGASGTAGSVSLAVSPTTQDFGSVAVGAASTATTFTLQNKGTSASGVLTLSATGQNAADYALASDSCSGKTLAAGTSCSVDVTFSPKATGSSTATLSASAAGSSATATASLSGTAVPPASLALALTTYDFGSIVLGATTAQQTFTVKNTGGAPSNPVNVSVGGADAADFALASNGCTAAVPAGGSCAFALTFTPSKTSSEAATITVATTPATTSLTVAVTGPGLAVAAVAVTPSTQSFGTLAQGSAGADVGFVVENSGGVATGTLTAVLGGSNASQFGLGTDGCTGTTLAANGGTCTVNVHFAPTATGTLGSVQATLQVGGAPGGTAAATLIGNAVLPATIALGTSSQVFGTVVEGQSSGDVPITVTNQEGLDSGPLTASLAGANVTQFGLGADACTGQTLAAGASCIVNVHFAPDSLGTEQATLTVTATPGGSATATLTGTAVTAAALVVSPSSQTWGTVVQGAQSSTVQLSVSNTGGVATGVLTVGLGGADPGQFAIASDTCTGTSVPPGSTCVVSVQFAPSLGTLGAEQATLTVSGTPGGSVPASLIGTAASPLGISPGTQSLGIAASGSPSSPVSFTVTNSSAVPVGPLSLALQGSDGPQFQLGAGGTCAGATLQANGTCTVSVTLSPTSGTTGSMQATLLVSAGASTAAQASVTGTAVKSATLAFASGTQSFSVVVQGQSSGDVPLTATNSGGVPTGTLASALSGANASQFGFGTDTCSGKTLAAGASCAVDVHFTPGAGVLGLQQATLTLSGTPGGAPTVALSGTAVTQAAIGLSPASQTFATTVQGSVSADTTFTATNAGGVATGPLSVSLGAEFAVSADTCTGQTLPANGAGSCTVKAHFAPTLGTLGSQQATLTVTGAPGGSGPATLIGTATSPLGINPSSEPFPNAAYQSPSASVAFTVTNASAAAVGPLTVSLGGSNASQYQLASGGTCSGATLPGGGSASCVVKVVFAPGQGVTGTELATLTVSAGTNTAALASLSGTAVTPATLGLSGNGGFGTLVQGQSTGDVGFTLTNTGGVSTGTLAIALGGANASQFGLGASTCPTALGAGASCTVDVHFAPGATTLGLQQATLTANATPGGAPAIGLSGTAVQQAALAIAGSGSFGSVVQGSKSADTTFTVTNTGGVTSGTLSVSSLGAQFGIGTDGCTGKTLAASSGSSCTVTAHFAPTIGTLGTQQTTLTVSASPGGSAPVSFTGVATTPLTIGPTNEPYGIVAYGASSGPVPFTVKNNGASSVGPLNVGLQGTNPTQFQLGVQNSSCSGTTLTAGGTCVVNAYFSPTSGTVGNESAILDVNAGANTDVQATLSGTGAVPATLVLSPAGNYSFGSIAVGSVSATRTYTLTNSGGVTSGTIELYASNSDFVITSSNCAASNGNTDTLAAGASCTFGVYYKPATTISSESATLSATAAPGGSPSLTLSGSGYPPTVTLTIEVAFDPDCSDYYAGTVTYTVPSGTCNLIGGAGCTVTENYGTTVGLTESVSPGSFEFWSGGCSGKATSCSLTMTASETVVVNICPTIE